MKTLQKISNSALNFRLNLNYNNVYSRLKMLLGSRASLFADISPRSTATTWFADDDAEYERLSEAPKGEVNTLSVALNDAINVVRKDIATSPELSPYLNDILEVPDNSFIFYRKTNEGYKFVLAGWGCKLSHQNSADSNSGVIRRLPNRTSLADISEVNKRNQGGFSHPNIVPPPSPVEPKAPERHSTEKEMTHPNKEIHHADTPSQKRTEDSQTGKVKEPVNQEAKYERKKQKVTLRVLNQKDEPVANELIKVKTDDGEMSRVTADDGTAFIGQLPCGDSFVVQFPHIPAHQEHPYEVESGVEVYDAYVKKYVKYSPVLFVEDQNGCFLENRNVKVVFNGQDAVYNSGADGMIQLPIMQEGQKFVVIETANYANSQEYHVTSKDAKSPYRFCIRSAEKSKVGLTVLDKSGKPMPMVTVDLTIGETPCQQMTSDGGRAEFPGDVFVEGEIPVVLSIKGKGHVKSKINYTPEISEYTIQLQEKKPNERVGYDWKWLALIPLLLLLAFGGYQLYRSYPWGAPTVKEMETGVVLIQSKCSYFVETGLTSSEGGLLCYYFDYDENANRISRGTFDESERPVQIFFGTGFLISKDGLIATNRHVADPIPPEEASKLVKREIQNTKELYQYKSDSINDVLRSIGPLRGTEQFKTIYENSLKRQKLIQNYISNLDRLLTLGDFKVKVECQTSVAFVNSIIETYDDFIGCSLRASGDPGSVNKNDVAIIQLKNKNRDVPQEAYIFNVPENDLLDSDIPDDYDITVLGYNRGVQLADIKNGIHPQPQPGKITIKNEKYRIGYNASTLGGSSGSPVLNKKGHLVAINNSGISETQGFNYGVRTKYLKELLDKILVKKDK